MDTAPEKALQCTSRKLRCRNVVPLALPEARLGVLRNTELHEVPGVEDEKRYCTRSLHSESITLSGPSL
jgi:hypothetical protein